MSNTQSTLLTKADAKYDVIKFILSLFVMAIHAKVYPMVLFPWLRIAVPLFFMMSSYFLFSKLHTVPSGAHGAVIKKFVIRNVQLYACWFVILLPITLYVRKGTYFGGGVWRGIIGFIKTVLFGSTFVASWFISACVLGVLIIYGLCRLLRKDWLVLLVALFAFCVVTITSSYRPLFADTLFSTAVIGYIIIFGTLVCSFPAALLWVFLGKWFAERKIKIPSWWLIVVGIVLSGVALYIEWRFVAALDQSYTNDSYFMLAPLCFFLFAAVQKIKPLEWKPSPYLRRLSTVIYVSHGSVVLVVSKASSMLLHIQSPLLSFAVTLACCVVIYAVIEFMVVKCRKNKLFKMLY